ncbi:MAG: 50S ribosomal protein L21 [Patescibacteria group bacterium]
MFAVIKTGGKQYIVREGQEIKVEKIELDVGKSFDMDALLIADDEGNEVKVGLPHIAGVKISAQVVEHGRADKKRVVKFKAKSRYRRHTSHRQPFTKIKIGKI